MTGTPIPDRSAALVRDHAPVLPIANERGERLVAVLPPRDCPAASPAFSLVVARSCGQVLLVRNRHRDVWELPGGWIDAGETAGDCALRELAEESAQAGRDLRLLAWIVLAAPGASDHACKMGAVFSADIGERAAFLPTSEISAIGYWPASALPDGVSGIDAALIARFARQETCRPPHGP